MKNAWMHPASWAAVVVAALLAAAATPHHRGAIGRLPSDVGRHLASAAPPSAASEQRLLALVTFHRDQRAQAESWVQGMRLHPASDVRWVRMPVFEDPGDAERRDAKALRLRALYDGRPEQGHLLPVFTDRMQFMEATGVRTTHEAVVLVLGPDGEVLARETGPFDEDKALIVRATLAWDF